MKQRLHQHKRQNHLKIPNSTAMADPNAASSPSDSKLVDWASLPSNVLDTVLDKLPNLSDYIHFSETCKPWFSVAMHHRSKRIVAASKKGLPHLAVSDPIFTPAMGKEMAYRRIYCSSSHGWVATVDENLVITLRKQFSPKSQPITLPPVGEREIFGHPNYLIKRVVFGHPTWYDYMIKKVVLSDDPDLFPDRYQVVVVFGLYRSLARIKSGEKAWTYCTNEYGETRPFLFSDVIFYRGKIHASETKMSCGLVSFEDSDSEKLVPNEVVKKSVVVKKSESDSFHRTYLVESSKGDLLLVRRFFVKDEEGEERDHRPITVSFKVSRLDEEVSEWVEMDGIGDDVLFLGDNESMCLSARDYGGFCRKRRNHIFYCDDETDVPLYTARRDMGVYNLEDGSFVFNQLGCAPCLWVVGKLER